MCFVILNTREATVNGTKEMSLKSGQRMNRKPGTRMTLLSTMSNTGETLEVSDWTLERKRTKYNKNRRRNQRMDLPSPP